MLTLILVNFDWFPPVEEPGPVREEIQAQQPTPIQVPGSWLKRLDGLIAWLIYFCTWFATHAPRSRRDWRFTSLQVEAGAAVAVFQVWSCPANSPFVGGNYVDLCNANDPHRRFPNADNEKFAMQRKKIDLMIAPLPAISFDRVTPTIWLWNVYVVLRKVIIWNIITRLDLKKKQTLHESMSALSE